MENKTYPQSLEENQTAVEWLEKNLPLLFLDDSGHYESIFYQAKQIEKQQHIEARVQGMENAYKTANELLTQELRKWKGIY